MKVSLSILLSLMAATCFAPQMQWIAFRNKPAASGASCSSYVSQTLTDGSATIADSTYYYHQEQKMKTDNNPVCEAQLYVETVRNPGNLTCRVFTDAQLGTQTGSSQTVSVNGAGWVVFTWSSSRPVTSGTDYYVAFTASSGLDCTFGYRSTDPYIPAGGYDWWSWDGATMSEVTGYDLEFKVSTYK